MQYDGITINDRWSGKDHGKGRRYRARVRDPHSRKYQSKNFSDREEAWRWARQLVVKFRAQQDTANLVSFAHWGERYLERLKLRQRSERHIRQCEVVIQRILAAGVDDMRDDHFLVTVERTIARLTTAHKGGTVTATGGEGVRASPPKATLQSASAATKNFHVTIAKAICRLAQRNRAIPYDALAALDPFSAPTELRRVFSVSELRTLLVDRNRDDEWYLYVALLAYTGARSSEVVNMTWSMVNWEAELIELPAGIRGNKLKIARQIPIQPELMELLRDRAQVGHGHLVGSRIPGLPPGSVSRGFADYAKRAGVVTDGRSPHCVRHTFCALMTAMDVSTFYVMSIVGHRDPSTAHHYSGRALELRRQVAAWPRGEFFFRRPLPAPVITKRAPQWGAGFGVMKPNAAVGQ